MLYQIVWMTWEIPKSAPRVEMWMTCEEPKSDTHDEWRSLNVSEAEVVKIAEDRLNASRSQVGISNPAPLPYHTQSELAG